MPVPTTEELLREAKIAYHALQTGRGVVEVRDSNGESVRYSPANASRLKDYIDELTRELNGGVMPVVRPMRPMWA